VVDKCESFEEGGYSTIYLVNKYENCGEVSNLIGHKHTLEFLIHYWTSYNV